MGRHLLNSGGSEGARGSLSRDTDAAAALVTDPWPLADCAKRVSGPLALPASTRDEPVNSSDSCPKTHQHWPPANANCCHSLLLNPDATIGIDLR